MTRSDTALHLRAARREELDALSELCLRSKAVWGYDAAFLAACRSELSLTPDDLLHSRICVAQRAGQILGVVQVAIEGRAATLEKLFVEPLSLHGGIGRCLFAWARETAAAAGAATLAIDADPRAAEFYRRMGATDEGLVPSTSIPGRMLPHLTLYLR